MKIVSQEFVYKFVNKHWAIFRQPKYFVWKPVRVVCQNTLYDSLFKEKVCS